MTDQLVYWVHSVTADEVVPIEIICSVLGEAEDYARVVSDHPGVLAAAVTGYRVDKPGRRRAVALSVRDRRQRAPYVSDDRRIGANGRGSAYRYA
jgi:hypothetical protein